MCSDVARMVATSEGCFRRGAVTFARANNPTNIGNQPQPMPITCTTTQLYPAFDLTPQLHTRNLSPLCPASKMPFSTSRSASASTSAQPYMYTDIHSSQPSR